MKHYINNQNQIFAFDDEQIALGLANGLTPITDAQLAELLAPTPEQLVEQAKAEAQAYLLSTDWVEPFLIKHELGIAILSEDSNKLVIAKKREEARELLK